MDADQQAVHDQVMETTGRVGRGPAVGYAYSAGVWRLHNESSTHLLECSLTPEQVRIVSLMTVRHWNAAYPWAAQATTALKAGVAPDVVEAINAGEDPAFDDAADAAVHAAAKEFLSTGNLSDASFAAAVDALGYARVVDVIGAIGHFTATGMMANFVGAEAAPDAPSHLKGS